jgi:aquaporin Z
MSLLRRSVAELLGTFWVVLGGCGAAVLSARFLEVGVGILGIASAFGLTVVTGSYALGAVSGGHYNPAITIGLATAGRFPAREILPYWAAQLIGAIVAAAVLYLIASGGPGFDLSPNGLAANGYGAHSPGHYGIAPSLLAEAVMTFMLMVVVLGTTDAMAHTSFAALAIGATLALGLIVIIPVTNGSMNPARSTGPALLVGGWALDQLWLFWVAPLAGAFLAGLAYPLLTRERPRKVMPAAPAGRTPAPPREALPAR